MFVAEVLAAKAVETTVCFNNMSLFCLVAEVLAAKAVETFYLSSFLLTLF